MAAPPRDRAGGLGPWLAKVVRDLAGMRRRSDARRSAREQAAEAAPAIAAPDALLDRMRLHRQLVDLVLELAEPYRSTIVARFFEGRSAAVIARAHGVPASTVRGWLRDGLARLRDQLDTARGERKAWAPIALALARGGAHVAKPTKAIAVIIAAILALLAGASVSLHSALTAAGIAPAERTTGPDGQFDFGRIPAGAYDVAAIAPDRAPVKDVRTCTRRRSSTSRSTIRRIRRISSSFASAAAPAR